MKSIQDATEEAQNIVHLSAASAAGCCAVPFGAHVALMPLEYVMIDKIAEAFHVTDYECEAVLAVLGTNTVAHLLADGMLSLFPGVGTAGKVTLGASMVEALGSRVIAYFKERSPLPFY